MLYIYFFLSVAILFFTDRISPVFTSPNGWWLTLVLLIGFWLAFIVLHLAVLVVSVLTVNLDKKNKKGNRYFRALIKYSLPMLFKICRINVHISGEDIIPENERVMLVCNHISATDPAFLLKAFPDMELGFIAKKEVYTELRFFAKIMKKLYCIPIDRENNREAVKSIIKAVDYIKSDKASIGVFPEGYTSLDGELHEFRNGAFKVATRAKAPIVVCTIIGSDKFLKNIIRHRSDIYIDVVKVIPKEEVVLMHTDKIGEIVHTAMKENLDKRKSEINNK